MPKTKGAKKHKGKKHSPYSGNQQKRKGKKRAGDTRGYSTGASRAATDVEPTVVNLFSGRVELQIKQGAWPNGVLWKSARVLSEYLIKRSCAGLHDDWISVVPELGAELGRDFDCTFYCRALAIESRRA